MVDIDHFLEKPRAMSASPDILLMTIVQNVKLTMGLSVRNGSIRKKTVKEECKKFDQMFSSSAGRLNVLIVCTTKYDAELKTMSEAKGGSMSKSVTYGSSDFKNIHEVILLNLSTPEYRAEFFGIQANKEHRDTLKDVLQKIPVKFIELAETVDDVLQ